MRKRRKKIKITQDYEERKQRTCEDGLKLQKKRKTEFCGGKQSNYRDGPREN